MAKSLPQNRTSRSGFLCAGLSLGLALAAGISSETAWAESPFIVGSMGDSITRAFDATRPLDNPALSWSTGDDIFKRIDSHVVRLKKVYGKNVKGYNVARSGGKAVEMVGQANEILLKKPNYVTILIGANDLCDWKNEASKELEALENNVRRSIEILVQANPKIVVALVPVPDMYHLWEIGRHNSCQKTWDLLNICPRLLSSQSTTSARGIFATQWVDVNAAYAKIADDFPANVKFAADGATVQFEPEHISKLDCFHPSLAGQNLLSAVSWESVESSFSAAFPPPSRP